MIKELVKPGYYKLTAPNGVMDTRNGSVYSEVVTKEKNVKYFVAYEG